MTTLRERLTSGPPVLLDGGLGTMLLARGLPAGVPPEAWVFERPDEVRAVHRAYVEAGSEAVHATTFGANALRLAPHGLAARAAELNTAAVRLAREAGPAFVISDIGPTGQYLPPVGTGDLAAWRGVFRAQAEALVAAGTDALHVETMSDLREALVALEALKAVAGDLPVLVSLTFERKKRGFFTVMGNPLVASLRALREAGADAVGANCSLASGDLRALAAEAQAVGGPLVFQPNAGAPSMEGGVLHYAQSPEDFAEDMAHVVGAALGGCCGTDPRFLTALRRRLGRA